MKTLPRLDGTLVGRILAIAIPLAGMMAIWLTVIEPIAAAFAERDAEIETRRALLARYIAVTRQEQLLRDSLSQANAEIERGELLPDQPPAMLAADLQAKIGALAQAHNVQIHSTQNLPLRTSGPLREAGIGFAAQGTQSDLRNLLIDIDRMQPFLFVDRLVITSFDAGVANAATPPLVAAEIDLYGVIRP
jgi:hypothetical protein